MPRLEMVRFRDQVKDKTGRRKTVSRFEVLGRGLALKLLLDGTPYRTTLIGSNTEPIRLDAAAGYSKELGQG